MLKFMVGECPTGIPILIAYKLTKRDLDLSGSCFKEMNLEGRLQVINDILDFEGSQDTVAVGYMEIDALILS